VGGQSSGSRRNINWHLRRIGRLLQTLQIKKKEKENGNCGGRRKLKSQRTMLGRAQKLEGEGTGTGEGRTPRGAAEGSKSLFKRGSKREKTEKKP